MTARETLKAAIQEKRSVLLQYGQYERRCSPHILGTKDGAWHCLVYQFAGGSARGLRADGDGGNWRCFEVAKMSGVRIDGGSGWHTARNYSAVKQKCVNVVDEQVP